MRALITAGGIGRRMGVAHGANKCLLTIGKKTILEHSIVALRTHDIEDIYVITGHCKEQMEAVVGNTAACIFNPSYKNSGIIVGIWQAKSQLYGKEFLFLSGDLFYDARMIDMCRNIEGDIVVSYEKKDTYDQEDSKVYIRDNAVARMGKDLAPELTCGEFGHMMKFSAKGSRALFDEIENFMERGDLNAYLMDVINARIEAGDHIVPADVTGLPRIEIDFAEDLRNANDEILPRIKQNEQINSNAE